MHRPAHVATILVFALVLLHQVTAVTTSNDHRSNKTRKGGHQHGIIHSAPVMPLAQKPGQHGYAVTQQGNRWEDSSKNDVGQFPGILAVPEVYIPDTSNSSNVIQVNGTGQVNSTGGTLSKRALNFTPLRAMGTTTSTRAPTHSSSSSRRHRSSAMPMITGVPSTKTATPSASGSAAPSSTAGNGTIVPPSAISIDNKVLIIAPKDGSEASPKLTLQGYGIPYEILLVDASGISGNLSLENSDNHGKYSLIVLSADASVQHADGSWSSALTTDQQTQLNQYQQKYRVRRVLYNVSPSPAYGVTPVSTAGCTGSSNAQNISFTSEATSKLFPTAELKPNVGLNAAGLWWYCAEPASTNGTTVTPVLSIDGKNAYAAVAVTYPDNTESMTFFLGFGDWSTTSAFANHAWIQWGLRGTYSGYRRILLNTQIDDLMLYTDPYTAVGDNPDNPDPNNPIGRIVPEDLDGLVAWQKDFNSRLPAGSAYKLEWGINGNGIPAACPPDKCPNGDTSLSWDDLPEFPPGVEYKKPLGTGLQQWPQPAPEFIWSLTDCQNDALCSWFLQASNADQFNILSHTFTHEYLTNVTYWDCAQEIIFNRKMFAVLGFDKFSGYSSKSLIPPSVSGVTNGDCIHAWLDNGLTSIVGDNSRPILLSQQNPGYWPEISSSAVNGWDGMEIIPRNPTSIYYNVGTQQESEAEFNAIYAGKFPQNQTFQDILNNDLNYFAPKLLNLRQDPYMFHQLNLRNHDLTPSTLPNGQTGQYGLLQRWVEHVTHFMTSVANWPILSNKQDDLAVLFMDRMNRDQCDYLATNLIDNGKLTGITVSAKGACTVPISIPKDTSFSNTGGWKTEQLGNDPLTIWVPVSAGKSVTIPLSGVSL